MFSSLQDVLADTHIEEQQTQKARDERRQTRQFGIPSSVHGSTCNITSVPSACDSRIHSHELFSSKHDVETNTGLVPTKVRTKRTGLEVSRKEQGTRKEAELVVSRKKCFGHNCFQYPKIGIYCL